MISVIEGKAWKFGDNINTQYMLPGPVRVDVGGTPEEEASFCMRPIRPEWAREVRPGDVVVAGKNFGCGSSRPAPRPLMNLGISCVIAESFARLFFRTGIGMGLPLVECRGVSDAVNEGDRVQVNLETGELKNLTTGRILQVEALPEVMMETLSAGGLKALLKKEYGKGN